MIGRPPKALDSDILRALPGYVHEIARRVGLERSACYTRLRRLEDQGDICRTRTVSLTQGPERLHGAPADWWRES